MVKAADCKSAGECLRRFESYPLHQRLARVRLVEGGRRSAGRQQPGILGGCSSMVELQPSSWSRGFDSITRSSRRLGCCDDPVPSDIVFLLSHRKP